MRSSIVRVARHAVCGRPGWSDHDFQAGEVRVIGMRDFSCGDFFALLEKHKQERGSGACRGTGWADAPEDVELKPHEAYSAAVLESAWLLGRSFEWRGVHSLKQSYLHDASLSAYEKRDLLEECAVQVRNVFHHLLVLLNEIFVLGHRPEDCNRDTVLGRLEFHECPKAGIAVRKLRRLHDALNYWSGEGGDEPSECHPGGYYFKPWYIREQATESVRTALGALTPVYARNCRMLGRQASRARRSRPGMLGHHDRVSKSLMIALRGLPYESARNNTPQKRDVPRAEPPRLDPLLYHQWALARAFQKQLRVQEADVSRDVSWTSFAAHVRKCAERELARLPEEEAHVIRAIDFSKCPLSLLVLKHKRDRAPGAGVTNAVVSMLKGRGRKPHEAYSEAVLQSVMTLDRSFNRLGAYTRIQDANWLGEALSRSVVEVEDMLEECVLRLPEVLHRLLVVVNEVFALGHSPENCNRHTVLEKLDFHECPVAGQGVKRLQDLVDEMDRWCDKDVIHPSGDGLEAALPEMTGKGITPPLPIRDPPAGRSWYLEARGAQIGRIRYEVTESVWDALRGLATEYSGKYVALEKGALEEGGS